MKDNIIDIDFLSEKTSTTDTVQNIIIDGFFVNNFESKSSIPEKSIYEIKTNSFQVLSNIPYQLEKFNTTGLVIGKVQSGKTSNFISIISMAFDNGFNICVVIGGNTNELLSQNTKRIKSVFNIDVNKVKVLNTKDNKDLLYSDNLRQWVKDNCKLVILTLKSPQTKNEQHLSLINKLFEDFYLSKQKIIIIDDEGDQATLNTNAYKNVDFETETYRVVSEIRSKLQSHAYLSVTATPQANILIDTTDRLSPDFGTLIYPGEGYCGLGIFHGENQDLYVLEVDEGDDELIIKEGVGLPSSLLDAMKMFFVGNGIRKYRSDYDVHSMLIHPSRLIIDQQRTGNKIQDLLNYWKKMTNEPSDISYLNELKPLLIETFNILKIKNFYKFDFEDVHEDILSSIRNCSPVITLNSLTSGLSDNADLFSTRIYLGGDVMGRGITIPGLAVTYMVRRAKGTAIVDSTEQRARWFGYKNTTTETSYLDVCRIFTTKKIKDDFDSIREHDEEVWTSIESHLKNGNDLKSLPRIFKLHEDINRKMDLTRKGIALVDKLDFSGWIKQTYFNHRIELVDHNTTLIRDFLSEKNSHELVFDKYNKHLIYKDLNLSTFIDEFLLKFKFLENDNLSNRFFLELLRTYSLSEKSVLIDILLIRHETNQTRRINQNLTVQQMFRGRDVDSRQSRYDGDRSLSELSQGIQLQIHFIRPTNLDFSNYSPTLAFHFSSNLIVNRVIKRES